MTEWFTFSEILSVAGRDLPSSIRSLRRYALANGWKQKTACYRNLGKRNGGDQFHISLLPAGVQLRLKASLKAVQNVFEDAKPVEINRETLWEEYAKLTQQHKDICQKRLNCLLHLVDLVAAGSKKTDAIAVTCLEFDVSKTALRNWRLMVEDWNKDDWLAALAPKYNSSPAENVCHPKAWAILKRDYLRPEKPTLASCFRRMKKIAEQEDYSPIPSLRTIRRWLERELPRAVQIMARENKDVTKQLYPAQRRTRAHLHAMQHVNIDGHKFDVFVNFGTKEKPRIIRPMMIAIQDLYSNMIVAHRISDSENKEAIRLAIGDMMEKHGIPEAMTTDNGRAFASKQITGGAKTRFRYKIKDEEPQGLLVSMGVEVKWTLPYSGQSKPIERAFRDICDTVARHPFCAGAYTGNNIENAPDNRGSKAIMLDDFIPFVAEQIAEHNTRADRNTENVKDRSFADVFAESMALETTLVKMPTQEQRRLWLLAAEQIRAHKASGEVTLFGQRYWTPKLSAFAAHKLTVRFDPQDLNKPVHIYSTDGAYLFDAPLFADARFDDVDQARDHSRRRAALLKATKEQVRLTQEMSIDELARIQPKPEPMPEPTPKKVRRMAAVGGASFQEPVLEQEIDFESSFAKAVEAMPEVDDFGENILPFKREE